MASAVDPSRGLRLYRAILRAHRVHLTPQLRALGDAYVREEFRQHRSAKERFLRPFFREWDAYLVHVTEQGGAGGRPGADLPADAVAQLSDEQRAQLARLREEAERPMRSE